MEVAQVQELRTQLERELRRLLEDFRSSTGVVPFVDVEWSYHQTVSSNTRLYAPPTVTVSLRL